MVLFGDCSEGRGRPSLKLLDTHVLEGAASKWKYLGIQLLNNVSALDNIEANRPQVSQ